MAPTFTLTLDAPSVGCSNWALASSDPESGLFPIVSMGPMDSISAKSWAAELIEHNTTYSVTGWVDVQPGTLTAELKRIRHDFRIVWANGDTETLRAKNAANAKEIRDTIRHGHGFIELVNANDDADFVNLRHVFGITYQPTEVDL